VTLVSAIVATDERGGIGLGGRLPWHLPNDLKRFKALTMGKPIVMGRRTYDSIGRALPGRQNIVVSRRPDLVVDGCSVVPSFGAALAAAAEAAEVCVIGGAEIYRLALPVTGLVHLTKVHATVDADTFFPALDAADWEEIAREDHPADERHAHAFSFLTLRNRRRADPGLAIQQSDV
jgi:dihydrofolate reductase